MKKILITLSSLTILTIAGNSIINNSSPVSSLKLKTQNTQVSSKTSLFNYQYGLLSADPSKPPRNTWITNQSSKDHKIYSYNLQPVIGGILSDGTKMENVFMVDEDGNLDYNREIPTIDQPTLDDSRTEMIDGRKITTIKNDNIHYSCSKYAVGDYFIDQTGNNTWQYLQQGQAEPDIDISHEKNTSNIENNDNESEALGLYYIAKQSRAEVNRIDLAVADQIAETFIAKSSLKAILNNNLIDRMVTLMNKNNNVFNFIADVPFHIGLEYKNYSMDYIFDNDNNLIEIYYHHYYFNDYHKTINYHYSMWYNGTSSQNNYCSPTFIIFNFWNSYAANWNDFACAYPTLLFDNNSSLSVVCYLYGADQKVGAQLTTKTSQITSHLDKYSFFHESHLYHNGGDFGAQINLMARIYLWHDDHNIYLVFNLAESSTNCLEGSNIALDLNNCTFTNTIN